MRSNVFGGYVGDRLRAAATASNLHEFDGNYYADQHNGNPERDPYHATQGTARFSSDLTERVHWIGSALYSRGYGNVDSFRFWAPTQTLYLADDLSAKAWQESWVAQSQWNTRVTSKWHSRVQVGLSQMETAIHTSALDYDFGNRTVLADFSNRHTVFEQDNTALAVNWGGQYRGQRLIDSHIMAFDIRPMTGGDRDMGAGYASLQGGWHTLQLNAGIRPESQGEYGTHTLYNGGITWQAMPKLAFFIQSGTGFRAPSMMERFYPLVGNAALKPEQGIASDAGFTFRPSSDAELTVSGFRNRFQNLIVLSSSEKAGFLTQNAAKAELEGIEVDGRARLHSDVNAGASYTWMANQESTTGRNLPYRPEQSARAFVEWQILGGPYALWVETVVRGAAWADLANTLPLNSSVKLNARLKYQVNRQMDLFVRGQNLTNVRSEELHGFNTTAMAFYAGLDYRY